MKLLRYGPAGFEKPGLLDNGGNIRDLSPVINDIDWDVLAPSGLQKLRSVKPASLPLVSGSVRLGVPYVGISKIVGIGLNYVDHAEETGTVIPKEPIIFMKATTSICGPYDDIVLPRNSVKTDWEAELGIVIGRKTQYVAAEEALSYVAGYCVINDVSERHYQKERGGLWDKGKGCDTFGPIGPWLVTTDEISNPQTLNVWCQVNGVRYQQGNTHNMIFNCAFLVSYISQFMTLLPGDLIATGTPAGVGMGQNPPKYLKAGDVVNLGVQGLGEQMHVVVA